jgi:diguanylate cyclase (GGDEF)-like protein/PAS domain S-box-containing protein
VDDEPQVLVALEDLLSEEFVVLTANSAARALRLVEDEGDLAVVLTDQRMPNMTGDEFLTALEGRTNAARMLVTGFADLAAVTRALNEGRICAYVAKPWDPNDLRSKVHAAAQHYRLAEQLASERRLFHELMDNISDGIYFKDAKLRFLRANGPFAERLHRRPEELIGRTLSELSGGAPDAEMAESEERLLLQGGAPLNDSIRADTHSETARWFSESKSPIRGATGEIVGVVAVARDVTERKVHEAKIDRLTNVRTLIASINAAIVRARDRESLLVDCCRIAAVASGLVLAVIATVDPVDQTVRIVATEPRGAPIVQQLLSLIAGGPHRSELLLQLFRAPKSIVIDDISEAHFLTYRSLMLEHGLGSAAVIPIMCGGQIDSVFCLFSDQRHFFDSEETELLEAVVDNVSFALDHLDQTKRLGFLAFHDHLTGLPNRDRFLEEVERHIASNGDQPRCAVIVADIGRFRHINETWGRQVGDALLVELAARLTSLDSRFVARARLFGNTFAILASPVQDEAVVRRVLEHEILPTFERAFDLGGTEVLAAARIGISMCPGDGASGETLVVNAEAALEKAKGRGQPYVFYAPPMNAQIAEQMALEAKLRRALEREEFLLHYQPKVSATTGTLTGLEALIRWRDATGALVPPGRFIPLLEETGLIRDVGQWVIEHAARQHREWSDRGLSAPRIAVNVSAIQLAAHDFVPQLERILDRQSGTTPGVDLEITESVFVDDMADSITKLEAARRRGLRVSMDDFGTGYSSLSALGHLPLDTLKVDRSFVAKMTKDPQGTSIVSAIISLAHGLDLSVVAEGVETAEQARLLALLQCDQLQGYLIAKPMPADQVVELFGMRFDPGSSSAS